jgi:hypothetical protein
VGLAVGDSDGLAVLDGVLGGELRGNATSAVNQSASNLPSAS